MKKKIGSVFLIIILFFLVYRVVQKSQSARLRLYWFIPDGLRADTNIITLYKWAQEGKLPHIKKLMDSGTYGYSRPAFSSFSPVNFATLLTGSYPEVHGINDNAMHSEGTPLREASSLGFSSTARKVPAIWNTLEDAHMKVNILSIPGSTPPEIERGVVIKGRWGAWGVDFMPLNFQSEDINQQINEKLNTTFVSSTQYINTEHAGKWSNVPKSFSPPLEVVLPSWGTPVYGYIYDSTNDEVTNYDRMAFSLDKKGTSVHLQQGQWSDWMPITLDWKIEEKLTKIHTQFKIALVELKSNGLYRVRFHFNNINEYAASPKNVAQRIVEQVGPMVDFADNFPFRLGNQPEDKNIYLQEANMTFDWHTKAIKTIARESSPHVVIHDIFTPNLMLTSPWWMGYIDPRGKANMTATKEQKNEAHSEVLDMYKKIDAMVGEIQKVSGPNTYIVLSSDHGIVPLNTLVNLNNLFSQKGWLSYTTNPETGAKVVDWNNSKVVFFKMTNIYINPRGLSGTYKRASGPDYEALRQEVKQTLIDLTDEHGNKPLGSVTRWEDTKKILRLDPERAGDLVVANASGFAWNDLLTDDQSIFSDSKESGYKQALDPHTDGIQTPFIISGPGIKKGNFLGNSPIDHVDQYPTIMKALGITSPPFIQGKILPIFTGGATHFIDSIMRWIF